MQLALGAYLKRVASDGDHEAGVVAAARAVGRRPWDVVRFAGLLARCRLAEADKDMGLTAQLRPVPLDSRVAVARIAAGQPFPQLKHPGRRKRGAFDTPIDMARQVVKTALRSARGPVRTGLDPACGPGSFLVAMAEAGVPEVFGTDIDALALQVAQIACPSARLLEEDGLRHGPEVDLICGNPPFVPPERQSKAMRQELRRRFPWLKGRFDLVVPFAATAVNRVRPGGGAGLVVPAAALVQPYGAPLRRRWLERHRITELAGPMPFPGASVDVVLLALQSGGGPAAVPPHNVGADELLSLSNVPIDAEIMPGDAALVRSIREASVPLGSLCHIDTGLVAHGPQGGKAALLSDEPDEGRVPYADARGFFAGERQWLDYQPQSMHRPKTPELFERPKVVVQRIRGRSPVKAAIDTDGINVGHTCTVVQVTDDRVDLEAVLALVTSPLIDAITRIERGSRLDLYPKDVAAMPVPLQWLEGQERRPLDAAWGLDEASTVRLMHRASR